MRQLGLPPRSRYRANAANMLPTVDVAGRYYSSILCSLGRLPLPSIAGPAKYCSSTHKGLCRALPPLGYMDPKFLQVMRDVQALLRYCFQTRNETTLAISGTGSAAMEAALANSIEPGDVVLVCVNGYFGCRLAEMASRYGADVRRSDIAWGSVFSLQDIRALLDEHRPSLVCMVMVETSTGALQPLEGVGALCHEFGALLLVDAVTGFCTSPLLVDEWEIDICYSCSQKGLSCCPGASPLTVSPRALAVMNARKSPVANWYLDLSLLMKYWAGNARVYHHTPPMNIFYGMREAMRLVAEEGLEAVWLRHRAVAQYFAQGLRKRGLQLHVTQETHRSPALTTVVVPPQQDAAALCRTLLQEGVEIGVGIGSLAGKVWRIGLMGYNATRDNVDRLLGLLDKHLDFKGTVGDGLDGEGHLR
ncbi:alanine-glyoxylate aminotransferase apoenzyme [Cyclospora cayetanensis]|uniref:alanine--glyoxylate transaminase n=1 Tax=Cyclospora cayetanensis TaxID=88456 RepID=A0A1D3CY08_9EIME|nr:alanine-glyoxylate aminotransferase apoenzyme [Cyclospora cayetanensis]